MNTITDTRLIANLAVLLDRIQNYLPDEENYDLSSVARREFFARELERVDPVVAISLSHLTVTDDSATLKQREYACTHIGDVYKAMSITQAYSPLRNLYAENSARAHLKASDFATQHYDSLVQRNKQLLEQGMDEDVGLVSEWEADYAHGYFLFQRASESLGELAVQKESSWLVADAVNRHVEAGGALMQYTPAQRILMAASETAQTQHYAQVAENVIDAIYQTVSSAETFVSDVTALSVYMDADEAFKASVVQALDVIDGSRKATVMREALHQLGTDTALYNPDAGFALQHSLANNAAYDTAPASVTRMLDSMRSSNDKNVFAGDLAFMRILKGGDSELNEFAKTYYQRAASVKPLADSSEFYAHANHKLGVMARCDGVSSVNDVVTRYVKAAYDNHYEGSSRAMEDAGELYLTTSIAKRKHWKHDPYTLLANAYSHSQFKGVGVDAYSIAQKGAELFEYEPAKKATFDYLMGVALYEGLGVRQDTDRAMTILTAVAELDLGEPNTDVKAARQYLEHIYEAKIEALNKQQSDASTGYKPSM